MKKRKYKNLSEAQKREYKNLSEARKNVIAWKEVTRRLSIPLAYCAGFGVFGCLVSMLAGYLNERELIKVAGYIIGCVVVVGVVGFHLLLYKENVAEELFGPESSWKMNNGRQPTCDRVNAQKTDGTVVWNAPPSELNWSLDVDNPIKEYYVKA